MADEIREVVVDMAPEHDFGEVSVDAGAEKPPETAPAQEPEPAVPALAQEPAKEPEPAKVDPELERIRKDNAALGYNLREAERRTKFIEDQLRKEREKNQLRELGDEHSMALSKIEHLKDIDPDAYIHERERIIEAKFRKEAELREESAKAKAVSDEVAERVQRVSENIDRDFPDMKDKSSELFQETRKVLETRYSPEEMTKLLRHTPVALYDIVSAAHARMQLKKIEAERADTARQGRVNAQGTLETKPPKSAASVTLTKEQIKFCKDNSYDPKEYAKFISQGRR